MESIFHSLLMLMMVVWGVAVVMRKIGLPTIMGGVNFGGSYWPIGVGHCARTEMAFIIASLGIEMGALDKNVFSVVVFTDFNVN